MTDSERKQLADSISKAGKGERGLARVRALLAKASTTTQEQPPNGEDGEIV